ncbi:MAG: protein-glutamate O-methyltransferase CheR [Rhizobiaceae bacterium]|nr:protein-glutamate O-methyltransferase CheR [Rhizobiaceae bacterium]
MTEAFGKANNSNSPVPLLPADLADICALIYARSGMVFGESKRYYLERRIFDLLRDNEAASVRDYIAMLHSDRAKVERLINSFTVNETYFYREEHQLACLVGSILPDIIKAKGPGDYIRIWSMPCSTGEEPYSIAIWLLENWPLVDAYHVEIIGSDIDTAALEDAAEGIFSQRSLSRLPEKLLQRYFEPEIDLQRRIIKDLRESVTFRKANIIDNASMAALGAFDVIFCRNLLIYFDDPARSIAVSNLHDFLLPGGYICLGHTESMTRISEMFETVRFPDAIVYRRSREA